MKTLLLVSLIISSFSLFAFDLDTARSQNKVCEEPTGYLKVLDPSVKTDIDEINSKRKQKYQEVAAENKQDLAIAESLMAKKLIEKYGACK